MSDIVKDIHIEAPVERVWAALTKPAEIEAWMGDDDKIKVDLKVGGAYAIFDGETTGKFTEVDKPTTLEYTWRQHSWSPDWKDSRVRWQLSPDGDGTHVQLHHWDLPNAEERDSHDEGWDLYFLGPMAEYLEDSE